MKTPSKEDWIYLIHHMHQPKENIEIEIIHHCTLFEKKDKKGNKYFQKHIEEGKTIYHVLDVINIDSVPDIVYDHLDAGFKIEKRKINGKKYAIISGLLDKVIRIFPY